MKDGNINATRSRAGGGSWYGTTLQYYQLYEHAALAIKKVDRRLQVGGPATCCCAAWITEFRAFMDSKKVPIDFISTHAYTGGNEDINSVPSIISTLNQAKVKAGTLPLVITEFGSSYIPGTANATTGTSHDDYDAASFLVKVFTDAAGIAEVLSYWSISDGKSDVPFLTCCFVRLP